MDFQSLLDLIDTSSDRGPVFTDSRSQTSNLSPDNLLTRPNAINISLEDESASNVNETILSVYWRKGKLGAAYYTCSDSELHLLNDIVDLRPDFNNLRSLLIQAQASQVITCQGLPDPFMRVLSAVASGRGDFDESEMDASEGIQLPSHLHLMSRNKKDLNYDSCRRYILGMRLGFKPDFLKETDQELFINSHIDLKAESMVISLGMLLKHLEKYLPQINLNHDIVPVSFIRPIFLQNLVTIDENTYKALQIFNVRHHPSAFKRSASGSGKEGLSVFGIFNRCKSTIGVKRMREIFTSPSRNIEELNARLDAVEFCCKAEHQHIVSNMTDCIKKIDSVTGILACIYRTHAKVSHWKSLYSSLYNAILVGQICQTFTGHSQLFAKIADSITDSVHEMAHYISQVVDFEESSLRNQFSVRVGIDQRLDLMRQKYSQVPDVLVKVARLELDDLPEFIKQCSIVYITELGYLLSVLVWQGDGTDISDYHLPNFEVKFIVNQFVHYKTPRCLELDNVLGDIVAIMSKLESEVMVKLIQFVHKRVSDVVEAIRLISELDCVISMAAVASENNYRRPVLVTERKLDIVKGRHPLQELCVDNFVPNDSSFSCEQGLVKILTGPNSSGKSVYLKQVALIAYMAHIGSFVPAQSAVIGVLDHLHTRIQTVETVSTRMSAFLLDLKQMSQALYNSTPSSLLAIDEFGKGTTEIDGLSLLAACLLSFLERKENCPYLLVSTHFHKLTSLLPKTPLLHMQHMSYTLEKDEIVYLHQISDGAAGSSLAQKAAKTAGLAEDAVARSMDILNGEKECKPNPKLAITRNMNKEVTYMKKLFLLEENDAPQQENNEKQF